MANKGSVKDFLSTIWIFHGRLDRKSYYKRIVFLLLTSQISFLCTWYFLELEKLDINNLDLAFAWMENFIALYGFSGWIVFCLLSGIWSYGTFLGLIALQRRRLSDMNRSGFWAILVMIICIVIWQETLGGFPHSIQIVWSLLLGLQRGTEGKNEYGPDPLSTEIADDAAT